MQGRDAFSAELARLLQVPSIELHLRPEWGDAAPDFRETLRESLLQLLQEGTGATDSNPYQPNLIARGIDFSISHVADLGGICLLSGAPGTQLGFDLESIARVRPGIAKRVCLTEEEFSRAPTPAALWTAKEAAFKAVKGPRQPKTVSELEITSWKKESSFETFEFDLRHNSSNLKGHGVSWSKDVHQFAIAVFFHLET